MAGMTVDQLQVLITADTASLRKGLEDTQRQLGGLSSAAQRPTDALKRIGDMGTTALKVGVVGAIAAVAASIPGAVKRIDTLVAFPRVLEAMGASSKQAAKATKTLSDRLTGLPTPLEEGASGVQALVAAGLTVEDATDTFLAFNNATLAASTEAGAAKGAFTQLVQSISKGKIEGQEWNSIVSAMPTAFQALSKESGLSREELRKLYRTNPDKLLKDLQRLDKKGGGGLASLNDQARAATGGIGTSFANMKTSITRGLADIVKQLGNGDLEAGQRKISDAVTAMGKAFGDALAKVGEFVAFVIKHSDVFKPIAAGIATFMGVVTAMSIAIKIAAAVQAIWNTVLAANPFVLVAVLVLALVAAITQIESPIAKVATAVVGLTVIFGGATLAFASFRTAVVTGMLAVKTAAITTFTAIMAHPLILALAGIIAGLTFVIGGLVSAFGQVSEAARVSSANTTALKDAQNAAKDSTEALRLTEETLATDRAGRADAEIAQTQAVRNQEQATKDLAAATTNTGIKFDTLKASVDAGKLSYENMTAKQREVYDAGLQLDKSNKDLKVSEDNLKNSVDKVSESEKKKRDQLIQNQANALIEEATQKTLEGKYGSVKEAVADLKDGYAVMTDDNGKKSKMTAEQVKEMEGSVSGSLTKMEQKHRNTTSGVDQGFFGPMGVALSRTGGWFKDMAGKAAGALGKMSGDAGREANNTKNNLKSKLGNLGGEAKGWGRNISDGLSQGISNGAGAVKSAAQSIANWISSTFKSAMDINSPSRVFAGYGDMIVRGLAGGIDTNIRKLNSPMSELENKMSGDFGSVESKLGKFTNNLGGSAQMSSMPSKDQTIIVKIGEEQIIKRVVKGINNMSYMNNETVLEV